MTAETDGHCDGSIDRIVTHTYDDDQLIHIDTDREADGIIEERDYRRYDDQNMLLGRDIDRGVDGIIDWSCRYDTPCPAPYVACGQCPPTEINDVP